MSLSPSIITPEFCAGAVLLGTVSAGAVLLRTVSFIRLVKAVILTITFPVEGNTSAKSNKRHLIQNTESKLIKIENVE